MLAACRELALSDLIASSSQDGEPTESVLC